MALTPLQIATLIGRYEREWDRFEKMAATVARHLSARLRSEAIPHVPTFRSKHPESLKGKLERDAQGHDFSGFEREFFPALLDLAGVRVILYRPGDTQRTCAVIEELFSCSEEPRLRKDFGQQDGYQACHRVVVLRDAQLIDPASANLASVPCEIQVVTAADHIWNELEHDIKYKTPSGQPDEIQKALLKTLRRQLNDVRASVDDLMAATRAQSIRNNAAIGNPDELGRALAARCQIHVSGDLARLLQLLGTALREVTPAVLARLSLDVEHLQTGRTALAAAGVEVADNDVAVVVAALWPTFGQDFVDIVAAWRGDTGVLARAVQGLDTEARKGKA